MRGRSGLTRVEAIRGFVKALLSLLVKVFLVRL